MPKYRVTSSLNATFCEDITAKNKSEAKTIVENGDGADLPELCHHCGQNITIDDFNQIIGVEQLDDEAEEDDDDFDPEAEDEEDEDE